MTHAQTASLGAVIGLIGAAEVAAGLDLRRLLVTRVTP